MIANRGLRSRLVGLTVTLSVWHAAAGLAGAATADELATAFDWTCGTWEGFRADAESGRRERITIRVESILGGAGQIRHIEVEGSRGAYRGFAAQVPDLERGVWVRVYTNDGRGSFATLEGELQGARTSLWRGVAPERSRESRLVSERPAPDHWRRTMSVSSDGGSTWAELWNDELVRHQGAEECRRLPAPPRPEVESRPPRSPATAGIWAPGAHISLSLKDADLGDVLRSFAQMAGFNLVLDPSVRGAVNVELHDVPWEQALEVILESHGLAAELDGTAWHVAPR